MKRRLCILVAATFCLGLVSICAQPGPRGGGMGGLPSPGQRLSGSLKKIFGEHTAFSANLEMQFREAGGDTMTMPGKMAALDNNARFETDMTQMKGGQMPTDAAESMKEMGMDKMVTISRPDKKVIYLIYPTLKAYAEQPFDDPDALRPESDFKAEVTELGKETVEGHPCTKNKVVVTDKEDRKHEFTVWNATDLKKFPIKVELVERRNTIVMLFRDVKLARPDAGLFEPPTDYKKYDSIMALMQQEMMKRMGGGFAPPKPKP